MIDLDSLSQLDAQPLSEHKALTTPPGTYNIQVMEREYGESAKKKTPQIKFTCQITEVWDDVEATDEEKQKLIGRKISDIFYLTEGALFMLNNPAKAAGLDNSLSPRQVIEEMVGQQAAVQMRHEVEDKPPEGEEPRIFVKVAKWLKAQ